MRIGRLLDFLINSKAKAPLLKVPPPIPALLFSFLRPLFFRLIDSVLDNDPVFSALTFTSTYP